MPQASEPGPLTTLSAGVFAIAAALAFVAARSAEGGALAVARAVASSLLVAAVLAGCATAPSPPPGRASGAGATAGVDVQALPPCEEQPSPPALPDVPGLTLPDGSAVYSDQQVGALTQVQGFVPLEPVAVRAYYEGRDDLELLAVEDEVFEAEILVTDGTHRMFVKAQVLCATGSNFTATVGSEEDSAAVPTPAGTPQPSG